MVGRRSFPFETAYFQGLGLMDNSWNHTKESSKNQPHPFLFQTHLADIDETR